MKNEFLLIVIDEDNQSFSIHGPMTDDTLWNEAVCNAQDEGRKIRCLSTHEHSRKFCSQYWRSEGFTEIEVADIVLPEVQVQ